MLKCEVFYTRKKKQLLLVVVVFVCLSGGFFGFFCFCFFSGLFAFFSLNGNELLAEAQFVSAPLSLSPKHEIGENLCCKLRAPEK